MNIVLLILVAFSGNILAMQDIKIIPLAANGEFSPDGKRLIVCADTGANE